MRISRFFAGVPVLLVAMALANSVTCAAGKTDGFAGASEEFCLSGEFNLAARLQGLAPSGNEFYPARFCIVTKGGTGLVHFRGEGNGNADMESSFAISYLPPDTIRIDTGRDAPDVVFEGASPSFEAARNRRIDPRRLVEELEAHPDYVIADDGNGWLKVRYPGEMADTAVKVVEGRLQSVRTLADLPLRGRVPVNWNWLWPKHGDGEPSLEMVVDGALILRAHAERRRLDAAESLALWQPEKDIAARRLPADAWPASVNMQMETLTDGVHLVKGVRTGFNHLVVETGKGVVVADAPAGWVELQQIPPADLVPGLGISGLSEQFIDFLGEQLPGHALRAVVLTHAHDDHAGGARAFAAGGAKVFAPGEVAEFLSKALNRVEMPDDRLSESKSSVKVEPVHERLVLEDSARQVVLVPLGPNPHVTAALGVWVPEAGIFFQSDLHVPNSDAATPRSDRALTECWFAGWATGNLPEGTRVLNSHTAVQTPLSRLRDYTLSTTCSEL